MRPVNWKCILLSLCVAVWPAAGYAQATAKTLDELRLLVKVGDRVSVTDSEGRVTRGSITLLSPTRLVLDVNGAPNEWNEASVARISQRRADSLANGALWGLAIGAGLATTAVVVVAADEGFDSEGAGWAALAIGIYSALGAGVGVGVDALIRKDQVIYATGATTAARWRLSPVVTPRVQGARLSVRF